MTRIINLLLLLCCLSLSSQAQSRIQTDNKSELLINKNQLIPIAQLDQRKIAVVTPKADAFQPFVERLDRYAEIKHYTFEHFDENTKYFNTIIIAQHAANWSNEQLAMALQAIENGKEVILASFSAQNGQQNLNQIKGKFNAIVSSPGEDAPAQHQVAESIFGGLAINQGAINTEKTRLSYPEKDEIDYPIDRMSKQIDEIAQQAIDQQAAPGMMVMAIKDGAVIFEKAYGYHTYDKIQANQKDDIYDLASISKIVGTTPVIMHLQEQNIINLDSTMGHYLWQAKNTNKANIPLRSVMLHEAGFIPFIPFYKELKPGDVQHQPSEPHQTQIAEHAFLRNHYYRDVMWPEMLASKVNPIGQYVYSDISMYVMKEVAERETAEPIQDYVQHFLYQPIGMKTAGYLPRKRFEKSRIVPTQNDTVFRKELLQGWVHDEGSAMAGGIAGHAGLFATANDLAIYAQLLLNKGSYGGARYFKPETVALFTSKQSKTSRRGLGFDRADPAEDGEYPSKLAGKLTFGHTGYTGTCIWIDPEENLTYIFLSNRVHPQVNTKIYDLNTRSRIQDVIYQTIQQSK